MFALAETSKVLKFDTRNRPSLPTSSTPQNMDDLHGIGKAPPARSMVPVTSATPESATLKLLKDELGPDSHLLEHVSVYSIALIHTKELPDCLPYKIFVGTQRVGTKKLDAWGFLLSEIRAQEGAPRLFIQVGSKGGQLTKSSSYHLDDSKFGS